MVQDDDEPVSERTRLLSAGAKAGSAITTGEQDTPKKRPIQKGIIIAAVFAGSFVYALDASLVIALAAPIGSAFDAAEWAGSLATVYLAASAAATPVFGKLADIFGRRATLVVTTLIFGLATLACALAPSMALLLFFRTIAGAGGAGIMAVGNVVVSDLVSQRMRGSYQGVANLIYSVGFSLGAPVGGWINDSLDWRAAFAAQLPLVALCIVVFAIYADIPLSFADSSLTTRQKLLQVDFLGSSLVFFSIFAIIGGLQLGASVYEWHEWPVVSLLVLGLVGLSAFIWIEGQVAVKPIIALDVLFHRTVIATSVANLAQAIVVFSTMFQLPLFFLVVLDMSASEMGWRYTTLAAGLALGSVVHGQLITYTGRIQPALTMFASSMIVTPLLLAATWINNDWSVNDPRYFWETIFVSFGNGGALTGLTVANIAAVDHVKMATVSGIGFFMRTFGQVLGVSLSSAFVQENIKSRLVVSLSGRNDAIELANRIRGNIEAIKELPPDVKAIAVSAYKSALRSNFYITAGVVVIAAAACACVPERKLAETAPAEQDQSED